MLAVIVIGYVPPTLRFGFPLKTPDELNDRPIGRAPVSINVGAGEPAAVTVKLPVTFAVNAALFALVMTGAPEIVTPVLATVVPGVAPVTATGVTSKVIECVRSASNTV